MINIKGFSDEGNWYKGNIHSHTVNSDGMLTPREAAELYRANGYSFLCLSEHDLYTDYRDELNREDFIILPGLEASAILYDDKDRTLRRRIHHIHGILGTEEMVKNATLPLYRHKEEHTILKYYGEWNGAEVAQHLCDEMTGRGLIATYNHPIWSRVEAQEFINTKGLWGLEIYNYNTVNESNTGYDETYWDLMLRKGKKIMAFASDDNHNEGLFPDSCGGYIVVKAPELTHEAIVSNMLSGNFYSSSGVEIYDWGIRGGVAYVECSPVCRIDFVAGNVINDGTSLLSGTEDSLTFGEYPLKGHEDYVRVRCVDRWGRSAWSNSIYLG